MIVVFFKKLPQVSEILPFIREMNAPLMVIQIALFTRDYNYRVVHVLKVFLQL